jgi:hypothetical protein
MSGTIVNNITRTSGTIAPTTGGLSWGSDVITGSTATVSAGNGYWINTTSNACTVTLPSSAEIGDQIILADYARTWSTNNLIIDSNGNNFQGSPDTFTVDYSTAGQSLSIVYSDATKGWIPVSDDAVANVPVAPATQKAIFAYGNTSPKNQTNLVSSSGVVAADVTSAGTGRYYAACASYGGDKAIIGYGNPGAGDVSLTNLISSSGVVATDTTGVGTARDSLAATGYGVGLAIFGYGNAGSVSSLTNKVSSSGVVASDTTGVGTARQFPAAARYGSTGQAIFAFGSTNKANLVSNTGVVSADVSGVGSSKEYLAGASYGGDKAIMGFGVTSGLTNVTNLINNLGVVGADVTGVGLARNILAAASYGGDKAIFGYGYGGGSKTAITNLVSNSGVVASDVSGVGTARSGLVAGGFSTSA